MQQSDSNNTDVYQLPVHLFVKSQKEAKKISRKAEQEPSTVEDLKSISWYKFIPWYKK